MRSATLRWCGLLSAAILAAALSGAAPTLARGDAAAPAARPGIPEIAVAELPHEARETLRRIRQGGPFPYERDGAVFGNFERLLPRRGRGYYREYTVKTPGIAGRGARRIVAGCASTAARPCGAGGELYYTDDHYKSFRYVRE